MADVTVKTGPIHQSSELVADFSNGVSPFFVNGGIISKEFSKAVTGDPLEADPDNLIVEIAGAIEISFAEFQTATGVKIAHTVTDLSGTAGKVLTVARGSNTLIRCLILYRV